MNFPFGRTVAVHCLLNPIYSPSGAGYVCLTKSNNTRWASSPITFTQLSIFPKDVLPVCSLAIAVHFKVSNFCSYVTLCMDSYVEDFPVQNNIPEHLVRGYTWPFPTAFVLFFVGQINTDIADTSLVSHFHPLLCQVRGPHYSPAALNIQDFLALRITLRAESCCVDPWSVIQWTWYANKYFRP